MVSIQLAWRPTAVHKGRILISGPVSSRGHFKREGFIRLYWEERKTGQRLMLVHDEGDALEVGGVRSTPRGFSAIAKTIGYDPGRAQNALDTMAQAKAFVESFRPWGLFGADSGLAVDPDVHPSEDVIPPGN
jgi:hypothetical protein